jgi:hypothetical protein
MKQKDCRACGGKGVVPWSSRYAADAEGQFPT